MKARFAVNSRAGLLLFLAVYACLLTVLLPALSLWLDEIYDLIVARMASVSDLLAYVPHISGNVPLNYLLQFWSVHLLGPSAFAGRLPSAVFSVAACGGIYDLARRLDLRWPLLPVLIFAALPLQFRYALEARPYELALCLTIWSTVAFCRVFEQPESIHRAAVYCALVTAGLYTFPFTLFVAAAHITWLVLTGRWRPLFPAGVAVIIAGLAFAPWYLHSAPLWRQAVAQGSLRDTITLRAIPMILREMTGAGYAGTVLTLAGVGFGVAKARERLLWLLYLIVPIICAVAADAIFGYFLAIRQMIFVLAPLALLFAVGVESMNRRATAVLAAALVITSLAGNVNFFRRPRENWRTAAALLTAEPCVVYSPPDSRQLYAFFVPALANRECAPNPDRVALAVSPYGANNPVEEREQELTRSGFVKLGELNPATPRIEIYVRR
jgi:uncharacterized membrane protein